MVLGTTTTSGIDFTGISLPFTAGELLSTAVDLMGVFGPFILLGVAIIFTPKLISLFRNAASSKK